MSHFDKCSRVTSALLSTSVLAFSLSPFTLLGRFLICEMTCFAWTSSGYLKDTANETRFVSEVLPLLEIIDQCRYRHDVMGVSAAFQVIAQTGTAKTASIINSC